MPEVKSTLPPALQHPLLQTPHAMFCRLGGVSAGPFAALNLSCHVGDKQDVKKKYTLWSADGVTRAERVLRDFRDGISGHFVEDDRSEG